MAEGVHTLPPELLLHIFLYLRVLWLPGREEPEPNKVVFSAGYMTITHVCRQWRKVSVRYGL